MNASNLDPIVRRANSNFFISHSSADSELAARAVAAFESNGETCWVAFRDIPGGQDWDSSISSALKACSALVLLVTSASNVSPHVRQELAIAHSSEKEMIVLCIDGVRPSAALSYHVHTAQWVEVESANLSSCIVEFTQRTRAVAGQAPAPSGLSMLLRSIATIITLLAVKHDVYVSDLRRKTGGDKGRFALLNAAWERRFPSAHKYITPDPTPSCTVASVRQGGSSGLMLYSALYLTYVAMTIVSSTASLETQEVGIGETASVLAATQPNWLTADGVTEQTAIAFILGSAVVAVLAGGLGAFSGFSRPGFNRGVYISSCVLTAIAVPTVLRLLDGPTSQLAYMMSLVGLSAFLLGRITTMKMSWVCALGIVFGAVAAFDVLYGNWETWTGAFGLSGGAGLVAYSLTVSCALFLAAEWYGGTRSGFLSGLWQAPRVGLLIDALSPCLIALFAWSYVGIVEGSLPPEEPWRVLQPILLLPAFFLTADALRGIAWVVARLRG